MILICILGYSKSSMRRIESSNTIEQIFVRLDMNYNGDSSEYKNHESAALPLKITLSGNNALD